MISLIVFTDDYMSARQHIYSAWNSLHFHYTIIISNYTTITKITPGNTNIISLV